VCVCVSRVVPGAGGGTYCVMPKLLLGADFQALLLCLWLLLLLLLLLQVSDAVDKGWFRKRGSKREAKHERHLLTGGQLGARDSGQEALSQPSLPAAQQPVQAAQGFRKAV